MVNNDMKFFTNEPERDLYSRFSTILKSNTQFFDVLVGYFRTSGFFKMYEALESVEKIRILVGLSVDKFTVKIIDRALNETKVTAISSTEGKTIVSEEVEKEFEFASDSAEVEKGVKVFIDWLKSGKLEIRMYTEAPIHAKVYVMRKDPEKVPDTFGSVITGSSNFSEAGLCNNLEFNVELKDYTDVKFALDKFEELWEKGVDIRETYIEAVEQKTWLRDDITPYQLYLKTLYEFFKEEINADKENFETLLPDGYMRLQYQNDAVTQARQRLDAYNCVGYPECEYYWACALPRLPEKWEPYLWEKYTPEDVVGKYCNDYNYIMMFYGEALKEPEFASHRELYNALKTYFLEGWKAAMVLQWVKDGRFDKAESMDLKKMYFDLATIEIGS